MVHCEFKFHYTPRSTTRHNMTLVMADRFTNWTEIVPLRRSTSPALIKAFRERLHAWFGIPKLLMSDNSKQFVSRQFKGFLHDLDIREQFTAPNSPRENPTERINRALKTIISTSGDRWRWDALLPKIPLPVNTAIFDSTDYSVFFNLGRQARLPSALFGEGILSISANEETKERKMKKSKEMFARKHAASKTDSRDMLQFREMCMKARSGTTGPCKSTPSIKRGREHCRQAHTTMQWSLYSRWIQIPGCLDGTKLGR